MFFSKLNDGLQCLDEAGEGTLVAEEQDSGVMRYLFFSAESHCFNWYVNLDYPKVHAVNFSCLPNASSRLFVDWEATNTDLYTTEDESKMQAKMIRKFISSTMSLLKQLGIEKYEEWVVENRTRYVPECRRFKPSFHIYADLWFVNNYEMMPEFIRESMKRAKLNDDYIDFGVYQRGSLPRVIGSSSTANHNLPRAEEDNFSMCLTASMDRFPDITSEHMAILDIDWKSRLEIPEIASQPELEQRILQLLKQHGETVTSLVPTSNAFYGSNNVGRNCLSYPGETHHAHGNRCIIWLKNNELFYKCLDPDHRGRPMYLGEFESRNCLNN